MCLIYREDLERALSQWDINENFKTIGALLECIQGSASGDPVEVGLSIARLTNTGGSFVKVDFITQTDYVWTLGGYPAYYVTINQNYIVSYLTLNNFYYVVLPRISEAIPVDGTSFIVTFKGTATSGSAFVRPHPDDSSAKIVTTGLPGANELVVSGGNQRSFVTDGTNWHTIHF